MKTKKRIPFVKIMAITLGLVLTPLVFAANAYSFVTEFSFRNTERLITCTFGGILLGEIT